MKKKLFSILVFASLTIMSVSAQKRGNVKLQQDVEPFTALSVSGDWDVYVRQGNHQSVSIETNKEELLDCAEIEVRNGTLYIKNNCKKHMFLKVNSRNFFQKVTITVTDLNKITASGGVDIYFETPLETEDFELDMSGGSDINDFLIRCTTFNGKFTGSSDAKIRFLAVEGVVTSMSGGSDVELLDIDALQTTVSVSGGSDLEMTGQTQRLTISASGGSDLSLSRFRASGCVAVFSGSSDGILNVSDMLNISLSGSSDVVCFGNPRDVTKQISGSSSLKFR
ncbi:MAG: head GIN domain-containing protein [Bacteroidales bacterium]|jgi:hypothetical protein